MGFDFLAYDKNYNCLGNIFDCGCSGLGRIKDLVNETHKNKPLDKWTFGYTINRSEYKNIISILENTKLHPLLDDWLESNMNAQDFILYKCGFTSFNQLSEELKEYIKLEINILSISPRILELLEAFKTELQDEKSDKITLS